MTYDTSNGRLHFSQLKFLSQSPAHYKWNLTHERGDSASFRLGRAVDALVIGAGERVKTCPDRKGSKAYQAFLETCPDDVIILPPAEFGKACDMADSLIKHKRAMALLEGERQKTLQWSLLGKDCEGTPDVFSLEHLTDLKTCRTSHPEWFQRDARRYGYHAQLSWYKRALQECGFGVPASCWNVAVESSAPYPVTVFRLQDETLNQGERMWRSWLERLLVCEQSDFWPSYTEAHVEFVVPDGEGLTLTLDDEEVEVT